jgi:hypothetical protein
MNARYFLPDIGRFVSADILVPDREDPQSFNRYTYTLNNPLKFTDPSGHCWAFASSLRNISLGATVCGRLDMWLPTSRARIDTPRVTPAPSKGDLTVWLVDQMVTNASDKAPVLREYFHSLHPVNMAAAAQVWTFGDQAFDQWTVNFGFFLYDEYGYRLDELTPDAFVEAFNQYISVFGEPPDLD